MTLQPGSRVRSYEVRALIGRGGMGEVYRAHDAKLGRDVALKVLPDDLADPHRRARFEREARAAAALTNPHICAVYDVGEDGGRAFLVMELLEGMTLAEYAAGQALDADEVASIGLQVADALEAAHARGVVHRDIKPGNVMVSSGRHIKVLDFGLARQIASDGDHTRTALTVAGTVVGTPHYMSPEAVQGLAADARSDIWSVGVVLYELASGRRPFMSDTTASTTAAILRDAPPRLPSAVPPGLRGVIDRCLAKKPDDRFQSAGDLRAALAAVRRTNARATFLTHRVIIAAVAAAAAALVIAGAALRGRRVEAERRTTTGARASANREANDAFELAMQLLRVQNDIPRGSAMLERALAADPHFAEAHRYHAFNYLISILNGYSNDSNLLYRAEEELRLASRDEPGLASLPSAFTALYLMQGRRELVPAAALEDVVTRQPAHNDSALWLGILSWLAGDNARFKTLARTALDREPLLGPMRMFLGDTLRTEGDIAGGIREVQKVLDQAPGNISAIRDLAVAYMDGGEPQRADDLLESRRSAFADNFSWRATRALLYAQQGKRSEALATMDAETRKYLAMAFPSTLDGAEFHALLGDADQAIEWLDRAVRNGDERIQWFQRDRRLAGIRPDARFQRIIDSVRARQAERQRTSTPR